MTGILLKLLLVAVVIFFAAAAVARMRLPSRAANRLERQRMPKLVPVIGGLFAAVGAILTLNAFTAQDTLGMLWPMRIAVVAMALGGLATVLIYRNFYVSPRADEVRYRTIWGREHAIAYADIASHRLTRTRGRRILTIRSTSGRKLAVNVRRYDMTPLFLAIDFKERHGRWPSRGEALGLPGGAPR
ncbi:hypothetical protein [Microbacterium capsulatum]|uniref:PH domain-containing protein n=1 Tax=Microbacterium capsulatum TaxID=3041921 RepID=A0ABU0XIT5_9MICO|nr:hypothetical protein [Microbacterium sp. ASV81]MDQ4215049.1 hypothetical protein [Microbacterium sp. ASV81]